VRETRSYEVIEIESNSEEELMENEQEEPSEEMAQ
jgi:hypothetical protein